MEHLLTMTAGLDWDPRRTWRGQPPGPAAFDEVFSRRVAHEPGSRWLYNNADLELLGGILYRATGMQADEFAARELFEPLGITAWDWEQGRNEGYPSLSGALQLRPLDMAKLGQMVLDGGRWQGRQVVSESWIEASTVPRIDPRPGSQRYGYLWHRLDAPLGVGPHPVVSASGHGSQFSKSRSQSIGQVKSQLSARKNHFMLGTNQFMKALTQSAKGMTRSAG